MMAIGSTLRLAGTAALVVAVVGCAGIDRTNHAGSAASPDPGSGDGVKTLTDSDLGATDTPSDEELAVDLDTLFDDWNLADLDAQFGSDLAPTGSGSPAPSPAAGGGGGTGGPAGTPLPPFDAGSFADLDAALAELYAELGAGEAGSEGSLP